MTDGTPATTGAAFGSDFAVSLDEEGAPKSVTDFSDDALDAEASTPAPTEPAQTAPPEADKQQEGQQQQPQAPDEGTPPATGDEGAAAEPRKWAGRYESPEALEHGYRHSQRQVSRVQQQLQQIEAERAQERQQAEQLRAALEQVAPHLERARQLEAWVQGQVQGLPPEQRPVIPVDDPSQLSADEINRLVNQRVQQATEQVRTQTAQEIASQELQRTVATFFESHTDAAPGTPLDTEIGQVIAEFQTDPQGNRRQDLFPITSENLEVAYALAKEPALRDLVIDLDLVPSAETLEIAKEAQGNPALAEVLIANPTALDNDRGLEWARKMASLPGMYQQAAQRATGPTPEQMRRAAHVETGGTGAPVNQAPGPVPTDEMDEAIAAYSKGRGDNVFGLQA